VGSLLVGSREFIEEAWRVRKMMGGGMRQIGVLAAAGLVALEQMPSRLVEDHANARRLAEGLAEIPGFRIDLSTVETNIVIANLEKTTSQALLASLEQEGIRAVPTGSHQIRFVTHREILREHVDAALKIVRRIVA
jgi:threonine aldolase